MCAVGDNCECVLVIFQSRGSTLAKKDKPVSSEDFVAMVTERLLAVQKDRDHMRKRAQEHARQQGKTYEQIMVSTLFLPPLAVHIVPIISVMSSIATFID